jgi:hypothetical protein
MHMMENRRAQRALRYFGSLLQRRVVRAVVGMCAMISLSALAGFGYANNHPHQIAGLLPLDSTARASTEPDSLYRVVIVAQRADCSGNLSHLEFLDRTLVAARIRRKDIVLVGPASDTLGLRDLLPHSLRNAAISLAHSAQLELLSQLGHNESPTMALYDGRNRLLVISATPSDVYERTVLVRALTRILTNNPAP